MSKLSVRLWVLLLVSLMVLRLDRWWMIMRLAMF